MFERMSPADDSQVSVPIRNTGAAQMDAELPRVSLTADSDEPTPGISCRAHMEWRAAPLLRKSEVNLQPQLELPRVKRRGKGQRIGRQPSHTLDLRR